VFTANHSLLDKIYFFLGRALAGSEKRGRIYFLKKMRPLLLPYVACRSEPG
jgi:hypothetical protein